MSTTINKTPFITIESKKNQTTTKNVKNSNKKNLNKTFDSSNHELDLNDNENENEFDLNNKLNNYYNNNNNNTSNNHNDYNNSVSHMTNSINNNSQNNGPFSWDQYEDSKLCSLVYQYGTGNWELIAQHLDTKKSPIQCLHRWNSIMKPNFVKGPWNVEEDKKLIDWIKTNGASNWSACSEFIPGRTGKQCRERWMNALNPLLKKGSWEPEEDYIIFKLFKKLGSKWSTISNYIAGRTENSIKNRFYSTLRRIASETRKNEKNVLGDNKEDSKAEQKLSLTNLMEYFNIAYIEKTKYIDSLIANLKLSENEILNSSVLKEILTMNNQKDLSNYNNNHNNSVNNINSPSLMKNNENIKKNSDEESNLNNNSNNNNNNNLNNKGVFFSPGQINLLSRKRENNDNNEKNENNNHFLLNRERKPSAQNIIYNNKNSNYNLNININPIKQELEDQEAETVKKNLIAQNASSFLYNNSSFNNQSYNNNNNNQYNKQENESNYNINNKNSEFKSMSLDALANKIESFCQLTQNFSSTFPNSKESINENMKYNNNISNNNNNNSQMNNLKVIQNNKNTNNNQIAKHLSALNNNSNNISVDADKITELLNQLNDLENFLQVTKNELSKIDTNNADFSYAEKLKNNLVEYEMPLNSCKVIEKDTK